MDQVRLDEVLKNYQLQVLDTPFAGIDKTRQHVKLVLNPQGQELILKTDRINEYQPELLQLAEKLESKIAFGVPKIVTKAKDFLLLKKIEGRELESYYYSDPEQCITTFRQLNDSYQILLGHFLDEGPALDDKLKKGREWLTSRMYAWAKPIVEAKLITPENVETIQRDINKTIDTKGEDFFGWAHGNIHGDHVILDQDKKPYLLDLDILPRPGNGYYDFLRSLDHLFLMSKENPEKLFKMINEAIKRSLSPQDQEEVRLVFAFRAIGVLGQDILNNPKLKDDTSMEEKFPSLLKWIKREY